LRSIIGLPGRNRLHERGGISIVFLLSAAAQIKHFFLGAHPAHIVNNKDEIGSFGLKQVK